ncbi:MAG TPA: TetR/AcrR family transcriptional regulator [Solirubrobacteraceae bacterium]
MVKKPKLRTYDNAGRVQAQEQRQDAMLDAAGDELFKGSWQSWQKTSLDTLARRAGVTKQTLLRYFGSKEGLLMQTLVRGYSQIRDQRWSAPVGDIAGIVDNLLDHYDAWGERSRKIGAWQQSGSTFLVRLVQAARQVHYDWVDYAFAPWLERLSGDERARRRAALIAICDVQTWSILTLDLGLARPDVHAILSGLIERLLANDG